MGKTDTLAKKYISNNQVFADAFNFYLYDGKQVINPDELRPMDTIAIGVPFKDGTKSGLKFKKSGECVDMCKAIKEIRQEEYETGRQEGLRESVKRMIKKGKLSLLDIAENLNMSLEEVQKIEETMKDNV